MGLAEAFDEASFKHDDGARCGVHRAMSKLPAEDADFLFQLVTRGEDYPGHAPMSRWLDKQGIDISTKILSNHRTGACGCSQRMPERYES